MAYLLTSNKKMASPKRPHYEPTVGSREDRIARGHPVRALRPYFGPASVPQPAGSLSNPSLAGVGASLASVQTFVSGL